MGQYAEDQYRRDNIRMFGFDPGAGCLEDDKPRALKPACPKCGKKFRVHLAVRDHMRDFHKAAPTQERAR
jgi:hypothetical protein